MAQVDKRLIFASVPLCLVQKTPCLSLHTYTVVSAVWCGCYITLNGRGNIPVNLLYCYPERTVSRTKNNDANPFAGYEPNAAAGQEDLGGDFNLAGAAGRATRTGSVFGRSDDGAASAAFPPPWPGLGLNPLGAETHHRAAADPTVPPLPEEEVEGAAEREDPSTELLRRVLAGNREPDTSRVKLAKMPAPTGSRGFPPAKAGQDSFMIRLRTWANVISPEFEAELVKPARQSTRQHFTRGLPSLSQDKTFRQWLKLAIQRNSDAIPEDGHGCHQRAPQRTRSHRSAWAERSRKAPLCHRTQSRRLGGDGRRHSSQRQLGWSGKGCQRRPQRCVQCDDSLQASHASSTCAR